MGCNALIDFPYILNYSNIPILITIKICDELLNCQIFSFIQLDNFLKASDDLLNPPDCQSRTHEI